MEEGFQFDLDVRKVLDAASDGIVLVDRDLKILWMNKRIREQAQGKPEGVGIACFEFFHGRGEVCLDCEAVGTFKTGRQTTCVHQGADGRYWESVASPIFDDVGQVTHVVMMVREVTERVFLEGRIESIYRTGLELSRMDPAQLAGKNVDERVEIIKTNVIGHTKKLVRFDSLVIRQLDERTGELKATIREGYDSAAEEALRRKQVFARAEGQGITGHVAATGESYLCRDARVDPLVKDPTVEFRAQVTVPVRWHDRVIGTMGVRSKNPGAYSEEDVKFLEIYAEFVAQALNTANLIRMEHAFTHQQLAEQLAQEIHDPINSVLNEVYLLLQEYIGHDSNTMKRLRTIERDIDQVREAIRKVIETERPEIPAPRTMKDEVLKDKHILVADDDEAIRQSMRDILTREGCVVEVAGDGLAAVEMLRKDPSFDLVLSDIKMPKMNGYEVYDRIRDLYPEMPVILMTAFGYDPDHSIMKARRQGLEVVLFKPFKVTVLRREIHKALVAGQRAKGQHGEPQEQPDKGADETETLDES